MMWTRRKIVWWWLPALCLVSMVSLQLQSGLRYSLEEPVWPMDPYDRLQLQHTHPVDILDRCLSIRVRNVSQTLSLEEGISYLKEQYPNELRMGMTIYEDNTDFWGYKKGNMHMFHYLEFLVFAYMAFVRISSSSDANSGLANNNNNNNNNNLQIPWVHAPYLSRRELRGSHNTNQLFTDLALHQSAQLGTTLMRGLEDNDDLTQGMHPSFQGAIPHEGRSENWRNWVVTYWREWNRRRKIPSSANRHKNWREMTNQVDAVLFIHRHKCDNKGVGQMHSRLADPGMFPAQAWSQDIRKGLGQFNDNNTPSLSNSKLVACYIDRQASERRMPEEEHQWLLATLQQHPNVQLNHLHMERYSGLKQIQLASTCDMILGVHGNGLSHELWMPPGSSIVEYYWEGHYVYCYSILAKMMHHDYLGFFRGKQIPTEQVMDLYPDLDAELDRQSPLEAAQHRAVFLEFLEQAVAKFEEKRAKGSTATT